MPATTDVTVSNKGRDVAARDNASTDTLIQPREQATDTATGAAIAGVFQPPVVSGQVQVDVAGADAGSGRGPAGLERYPARTRPAP